MREDGFVGKDGSSAVFKGVRKGSYGFAMIYVMSSLPREILLSASANGPLKAFVDGDEVLSHQDCDQKKGAIGLAKLRPGMNRLVVQVGALENNPEFLIRVTDRQGREIATGLDYLRHPQGPEFGFVKNGVYCDTRNGGNWMLVRRSQGSKVKNERNPGEVGSSCWGPFEDHLMGKGGVGSVKEDGGIGSFLLLSDDNARLPKEKRNPESKRWFRNTREACGGVMNRPYFDEVKAAPEEGDQAVPVPEGDWRGGSTWTSYYGPSLVDLGKYFRRVGQFKNIAQKVGYAFVYVDSPSNAVVYFELAADDGYMLWVNGEKLLNGESRCSEFQGCITQFALSNDKKMKDKNRVDCTALKVKRDACVRTLDKEGGYDSTRFISHCQKVHLPAAPPKVRAKLKRGRNRVLIKVGNGYFGWGFRLRALQPNGKAADYLQYSISDDQYRADPMASLTFSRDYRYCRS